MAPDKNKEKTKEEPEEEVKEIKIIIGGEEFISKHRTFSSGRKGYGLYGTVKIDGYPHRISLNLIEF